MKYLNILSNELYCLNQTKKDTAIEIIAIPFPRKTLLILLELFDTI